MAPLVRRSLAQSHRGKAPINNERVHVQQLVFRPEFSRGIAPGDDKLALGEQVSETRFKKGQGPLFVSVGLSGAFWRIVDSRMFQLAIAARQPAADFAQCTSTTKLTKKHGHGLIPAAETFFEVVSAVFSCYLFELEEGE
jgi:hypothetical protein